ncbi:MAG: ribosomal RNA small subunit methyltransferase A [Planctomycetes bacterium]|nr:ribosomal RNA small subunit methyltransferase A [Planctomycetota bacterium]NOG53381.1 ribosomal RNA small subunit methyltransferase A [Planctomycetota bacterium]
MQTISDIRRLLSDAGIRPRHRLGQNFLHDQNQLLKLVTASVARADTVDPAGKTCAFLEVGPGTGALTEALLEHDQHDRSIVACEIDQDMVSILEDRLAGHDHRSRLSVLQGDCLDSKHALNARLMDLLDHRDFILAANLPYQAATPLMGTLLCRYWQPGCTPRCRGMYVTIQREVGQRLAAGPGTRDYGPLAVLAALLTNVRVLSKLSPHCFWPAPKVTSSILAIEPLDDDCLISLPVDPTALSTFLTSLFSKRRKQIGSILGSDSTLPEGVTGQMRPEQCTPAQLLEIATRSGR